MVSIENGLIYITTGTVTTDTITGGTTVKIFHTKVDDSMDNPVTQIPIPVVSQDKPKQGGSGTPKNLMINLLRVKRTVTIQGWLIDESGDRHYTKKSNLITLFNWGGSLSLVWGNTPATQTVFDAGSQNGGYILKMMITETAGQMGASLDGFERQFAVQLTFINGVPTDEKS